MYKIFEKIIFFDTFKLHFILLIIFLLSSYFIFFNIFNNERNFIFFSFLILISSQIIFYTYIFIKCLRRNLNNRIKSGSILNIPFFILFMNQFFIIKTNEINILVLILSFFNFFFFSLISIFLFDIEHKIKHLLNYISNFENIFNFVYYFNENGFNFNLNNNNIEFSFINKNLIINENFKISIFDLNEYIKENSLTFERLKKEDFKILEAFYY